MCQGNGEVTGVHPFVLLFSGKIDCTFKTIVKVCGCCDKHYIWKQRKVDCCLCYTSVIYNSNLSRSFGT